MFARPFCFSRLAKGTRCSAVTMVPVARAALRLAARGIQHTSVRQAHRKYEPNFHDKYGNMVLVGGAVVFTAVWAYVLTQAGMEWGLSPVGRVTPKEWKE